MTRTRAAALIAVALLPATACNATAGQHRHSPTPTATATPGSCHASSNNSATVLPDHACTPGVTNPDVTQATVMRTICVRGWTSTIRPPVTYTAPLKLRQMAQYGYGGQSTHGFEEDHLISLELGGAPRDPRNLWPELGGSPNPKDRVENTLRSRVCSGQITLAAAQQAIATDWTTALQTAK